MLPARKLRLPAKGALGLRDDDDSPAVNHNEREAARSSGPRFFRLPDSDMSFAVSDPLEAILRHCAAAAPKPWYPKLFAEESGVPRDSLDAPLERLRLGGLIQLTEWVEGRGQGYALTSAGQHALQDPRELARLRQAGPPRPPAMRPPVTRTQGATTFDRGEDVREALLDHKPPIVGRVLLAINILVFIYGFYLANQRGLPANSYLNFSLFAGVPQGDQAKYDEVLRAEGSLNGLDYMRGQWWRLLTYCFVHIGILHLGVNMFALYRSGAFLEQMWGHWRFAVIYLVSGIGGGCLALAQSPGGLAGASGALCGIFASEAAWLLLNRRFIPPPIVRSWMGNLLTNFLFIAFISLIPGISWAGHLGGAIVGVIVGVLLHYHRYGKPIIRWLAIAAVFFVPVLCWAGMVKIIAVNPRWTAQLQMHERADFDRRYVDQAEKALKAANEATEKALAPDLLNGRVEVRDPDKVAKVADELAKAQEELVKVVDELTGATFDDPAMTERRDVLEQYLRKEAELCRLAERFLREKDLVKPGSAQEKEWERDVHEASVLRKRYKALP
jgi:rhomboid protease GluP